jgi:hypothetical protein
MNWWFGIINGVNLLFGGYFLFNALTTGAILTQAHFNAASYLYGATYVLSSQVISNPLSFITFILGGIPLAFSLLFWLIPLIRYRITQAENEAVKFENLRKDGYRRIWNAPLRVKPGDINPGPEECRPSRLAAARDRVLKELGAYAVPEVEIESNGTTVYSFKELEREKQELEKYRSAIDPSASTLGATVFDSG